MTQVAIIAFIIVLLVGCYALFALSNVGWRRYAGPSLLAIIGALVVTGYLYSLGSPRPVYLSNSYSGSSVIAITYEEGKAIYLWVSDGGEPVAITIPWSDEKAKAIRSAQLEGEQTGGTTFNGDDSEQPVHPNPVTSYPSKE